MKKCIIIGGADIANYSKVKQFLSPNDFYIYCDSGLKHQPELGYVPDLIVGDFDSFSKPNVAVETIVLPCEKDDTDSVYAVKEAVKRGFDEFLLLGMVGNRLDHTLGNVSVLLFLEQQGKHGVILDDYSEMEVVVEKPVHIPDRYSYFSLLNISGTANGIIIKNAKYPLDQKTITCEYQYGISNEVLPGKTAEVSVADGKLLLIKIW